MSDDEQLLPGDDEPARMTGNERTVWAYLVAVLATSGAYLAVMGTRLAHQPAEQISWVVPMLWAIGASVVGSIVVTILLTIAETILATIARARLAGHGAGVPAVEVDMASDARDREIDRRGDHALVAVLGAGSAAALVLTMLDADGFWIGNALFVAGTIGAVVETTTKLRLYRRGF